MRRLGLAVRLAIVALAPVARLHAQDSLGLAPTVTSVVVGGSWDQGPTHGTFRLVVVRGRAPTDSTRLYLQWLQQDADRTWVLGTNTVAGMGGGIWALEAPSIGRGPTGGWVARIGGEDARAATHGMWIIPLGQPGSLAAARRY